ncbi:MAG TPA: shikimate dehydrogenase [Nitrospina sp.]|jgi:3-dehydroquinate dehydratase/shikimate dehydrogenase|nr:3-dehydroquinate dehydratase [Nitrospinota bacterium]MDP6336159.1 shikimate dehydrogenase [Nitrospinaceae bacterium]HAX45828.1 shikimate dehydrogenase [Nitrospina sp.]|tara:strand:- start:64 stop:1533 length:1470 start_codon:yes stop_codon:yes gene_type:complete
MICIPIVGPTQNKSLEDIAMAEPLADFLELRLDLMKDYDLGALLQAATKPCIVTNRTKREGGQFAGTEEERVNILKKAMDAGAEYVDIETSTPKELLKPFLESDHKSKIILSYHNFTDTPEELEHLYKIMCEMPADVIKIVTYARDITNNLAVFKLIYRAKKDDKKIIALCMGERGEISRILSPLLGGFLTFGSLETGKESAPGQITAVKLRDIYRVGDKRDLFKIYGVIGNPISKSMGYLIHNRAFKETGSSDIYVPFLVDNVEKFFKGFSPYFEGLSVTMPFKEDIMAVIDEVDETARKIGAVNTVVRDGEGWKGYNTDCTGAVKALEEHIDLNGKKVLIIGAGGTAKAIGHGVREKGAKITVTYNKNKERGTQLAKELGAEVVNVQDAGEEEVDVLINCSPVGMNPDVEATPISSRHLRKGMIVFDSVYNPPETRLIRDAKAAGCIAISGIELFINQAVGQFELWTGQKAPANPMRDVVVKTIEGQ